MGEQLVKNALEEGMSTGDAFEIWDYVIVIYGQPMNAINSSYESL